MRTREGVMRGMAAGLLAAGVMSAARLLAHREGLIEQMTPQALQARVAGEAGLRASQAGQQLAAELIHHAVGLAAGGALGAATARPRLLTGVAYGLAIWLVDAVGVLPALRVRRRRGGAVDATAHGIFGAVLAFAMRELATQRRIESRPVEAPVRRRVG